MYVMAIVLLFQSGFIVNDRNQGSIISCMTPTTAHSLNTDSRSWISDDQRKKAKLILDKLTPMLFNDARNRKWSYQGMNV